MKKKIKVELVFEDLIEEATDLTQKSVYNDPKHWELTLGSFHSGTLFDAEIELDESEIGYLEEAEKDNIRPVFKLYLKK